MLIKTPSGGLVNLPPDFISIEIRADHCESKTYSVIAAVPNNAYVPILEGVARESCSVVCDAIEVALLNRSQHLVLSPLLAPAPELHEVGFDDDSFAAT